jgi:hypothetical protein
MSSSTTERLVFFVLRLTVYNLYFVTACRFIITEKRSQFICPVILAGCDLAHWIDAKQSERGKNHCDRTLTNAHLNGSVAFVPLTNQQTRCPLAPAR